MTSLVYIKVPQQYYVCASCPREGGVGHNLRACAKSLAVSSRHSRVKMSESLNSRDKPFKDMLLAVSKQLNEQHVEQLQYLTECRCSSKPLELLTALRNKGAFSPVNCAPLEELLKKIDRYDVADDVRNKYSSLYPDQS